MSYDQLPISESTSLTPVDEAVLDLMNQLDPDPGHAMQVMHLSSRLFDDLVGLHGFGASERRLLCIAALLHDIGWSVPASPHHKASMDLILNDTTLPLTEEHRMMISQIARYHRKAHPSLKHGPFASLSPVQQNVVRWDAALLRIADALDRSHRSLVQMISAKVTSSMIQIHCDTGQGRKSPSDYEMGVIKKKSELLNEISGKTTEVKWN